MADYIPSFYRYLSSITLTNAGAGYNNVPTISIDGGGGTGATATATVFNGVIKTFVITNKGTGYTSTPTVTITPNASDTISTQAVGTAVLDSAQDNTTLETRNRNYLIKEQVPEYILSAYPTFVTFLEKYYAFMDTNYSDPNNYTSDIDNANSTFLDKWRGALVSDFPKSVSLDKSFFYKRAKDFYEAKGSRRSIEAWFRILYGENVDVTYPYQYVLKPSDGIYNVERAVKIQEAEHGGGSLEPLQLEGKKIDLRYKETTGTVTITKTVNASVRRVEKNTYQTNGLTLQRFELILAFDDAGVTTIPGPGAGATFTASVSGGGVSGISTVLQGSGYNAAPPVQIFAATGDTITTQATAHALVADGKITSIVVDNAGAGYTSAPTIELKLEDVKSYVVDDGASNNDTDIYGYIVRVLTGVAFKSYGGSAPDAGFKIGQIFAINESGDDGKAYAISGYFKEDYTFIGGSNDAFIRITAVTTAGLPAAFTVVNPGSTFLKDTADINIVSPRGETAVITLSTGYLFEYEGKWKNDQGKLSDVNVLADNKRYQPFSYVIKSGIAQTSWNRALRDTVHPSGMEVFGDLIVKSEINFNVGFSVETVGTLVYLFKSTDEATTSETMQITWTKILADTGTATEQLANAFTMASIPLAVSAQDQGSVPYCNNGYWNDSTDGNVSDNYNIGDELFEMAYAKILSETASTSDVIETGVVYIRAFNETPNAIDVLQADYGKTFSDSTSNTDIFAITYFRNVTETVSVTDTDTIQFNKGVSETLNPSDALNSINTSKGITETKTVTESLVNALNKPATDSATTIDTGIGAIHDYCDPTYLGEDYVGVGWNFT